MALAAGFVAGAAWHLPLPVALRAVGAAPLLERATVQGSVTGWTARTLDGAEARFEASPLLLATGRYGGRLELTAGATRFTGRAVRGWDGTLGIEDGVLEAGLAPLSALFGLPSAILDGHLEVTGIAATFRGGALTALACDGAVDALRGQGGLALGALELSCLTEDAGPTVRIADRGGPLALTAELRFAADGRYLLTGTAGARPGAPPVLAEVLPLLGRASGPDQVVFKYAGALPAP